MTELNLTDYEFGFLVAKSQEIVKSFDNYDGDTWHGVTVVDVVHGRKDVEYDLNIWDDDDGKMCCSAYAVKYKDEGENIHIVYTDDSTFTRLW